MIIIFQKFLIPTNKNNSYNFSGSVETPDSVKRKLAASSHEFNLKDRTFCVTLWVFEHQSNPAFDIYLGYLTHLKNKNYYYYGLTYQLFVSKLTSLLYYREKHTCYKRWKIWH